MNTTAPTSGAWSSADCVPTWRGAAARGEGGLGAGIHLADRRDDAVGHLGKAQIELVDLGRGRGRDERDRGGEPAQPQDHGYSARPWMK